jgi:hypothetical protein
MVAQPALDKSSASKPPATQAVERIARRVPGKRSVTALVITVAMLESSRMARK